MTTTKRFNIALNFYRGLLLLLLVIHQISFAQPIGPKVTRVLFLGNSITWAGNYVNVVEAYLRVQEPARQWEFINVGLSSETVSGLSEPGHAGGSFSRPDLHERLARVLQQTKPDLVFACYGMNDGIYMPFDIGRFKKFRDGINWLHTEVVKTGARMVHLTPPDYDEVRGKSIGYGMVLDRYAEWLLAQRRQEWEVIDIHYPMKKYLEAHRAVDRTFGLDGFALAQDGVHPGEVGHWIMARGILAHLGFTPVARSKGIIESLQKIRNAPEYVKLVGQRQNMMRDAWLTATKHTRPGVPAGLPLSEAEARSAVLLLRINSFLLPDSIASKPVTGSFMQSRWMGFARTDFVLGGRKCLVVAPARPATGKPWIWRTEFFGHEPQGDSTLLTRGFHVAYIDLQDMYGAPLALDLMDRFYGYLVKDLGLSNKTVLEGFSRGGLFAFNWAARNPGRVSSLYVDAPVCDFKSWPGGKGKSPGSPADWEKLKLVYGFDNEQQAIEYKGNPVDNLEPLVKAGIPILCVCGETDDLVPMSENISIVEERYRKAGGNIKMIVKANNGHHPHSLKDPTPIVDFITAAFSGK